MEFLVLLLLIGYVVAAFTQTSKGRLSFEGPQGQLREAPVGFSWTTLFFGPFPALLREHWVGAVAILLLVMITAWLAPLVIAFLYNKWYIKHLISNGYKVAEADRSVADISAYLGLRLPEARN